MKCTNCGNEIAPGYKFCASCGASAPSPETATASASPRPHYCVNCGAELAPNTRFCTSCGAAQGAGAAPSSQASPPQSTTRGGPPRSSAPLPDSVTWVPSPPSSAQTPTTAGRASPQGYHAVGTVAADFKGVGARFVAQVIDTILYFIFFAIVASATGNTTGAGFEMQGAPAFLTFAVWAAYYIVMEAYLGGTIGKLILGMRVVNARGHAPGLIPSLIRNVMRIVDFLPFFYILGIILMAISKEKQRAGDRAAGTYVVSSRSAAGLRVAAV